MDITTKADLDPEMATNQVETSIARTLRTADKQTASSVRGMALIQQARLARLQRTTTAVIAEHGSDSTQAIDAQAEAAAAQSMVARIHVVNQQMTTAVPTVTPNGWAIHGRVYDSSMQPISGYTVFLVDEQKTYQRAFGFSYTDGTGYFLINYGGTPSEYSSGTASTSTSKESDSLFLEITNKDSQPVYLGSSALQLNASGTIYLNIPLSDSKVVLGSPPDEIREVAFPPKRK